MFGLGGQELLLLFVFMLFLFLVVVLPIWVLIDLLRNEFTGSWYMPAVDDYRTLVKGADFHSTEVWGENADRYFPDTEALIKWVDQPSLVPFMACVAEQNKASFRELVVRRMIEETRQADGTCFETFRRINLLAHK